MKKWIQTLTNKDREKERALTRETGAEQRKTIGTTGRETRLTQAQLLAGQERQIGLRGTEERATTRVRGEEERALTRETGAEQRKTIGTTAREQRTTDLQKEMFRRYKENRDFEQAQSQYRT